MTRGSRTRRTDSFRPVPPCLECPVTPHAPAPGPDGKQGVDEGARGSGGDRVTGGCPLGAPSVPGSPDHLVRLSPCQLPPVSETAPPTVGPRPRRYSDRSRASAALSPAGPAGPDRRSTG